MATVQKYNFTINNENVGMGRKQRDYGVGHRTVEVTTKINDYL